MVTSFKRTYASMLWLPGLLYSGPLPCSRPLLAHAPTGDSWTHTGKSGSIPCGVTAAFSWLLVSTRVFLCLQEPGERSSDPTRDSPRLAYECPGVSGEGVGRQWPVAGSGALSAAVTAWDLLKEVAIIFMTSTIVWPQVKPQGGNTAPPISRKLD